MLQYKAHIELDKHSEGKKVLQLFHVVLVHRDDFKLANNPCFMFSLPDLIVHLFNLHRVTGCECLMDDYISFLVSQTLIETVNK